MQEHKKNLIRDVTIIFDKLPENKQERAIGIMQGMLMVTEEDSGSEAELVQQ